MWRQLNGGVTMSIPDKCNHFFQFTTSTQGKRHSKIHAFHNQSLNNPWDINFRCCTMNYIAFLSACIAIDLLVLIYCHYSFIIWFPWDIFWSYSVLKSIPFPERTEVQVLNRHINWAIVFPQSRMRKSIDWENLFPVCIGTARKCRI